jgi:outer membrane protein, heavy metal efflux system
MRTRNRALAGALVTALAVFSVPVLSQPATAPPSTIRQGLDAAWARQPAQRAASLRVESSDAALRAAQRWTPEPATLELTTQTDRFTQNNGSREYEATVAVPLWMPGERSRSQAAASALSAQLQATLAAARWRLAGEVREAHWAYQRALVEEGLSQQRLASTWQLAADVARRVQAGDLARSDGHQAEAAAAAAESAAAEAAVALLQAAQRWSGLTGKPPASTLNDTAEATPGAAPADASHPALQELSTRVDVARRQLDLLGSQVRANPELTVGAARERGEFAERYTQSVIVGVRVPLGTHSANRSKTAAASAEQVEAETLLALAQERVQADAQAARDRVAALTVASGAADRRARLAAEARGFFEKSFRLGESDLPTRLRVELDAVEAQRQASRARIELAAAISQLRQSLGLLPE